MSGVVPAIAWKCCGQDARISRHGMYLG